MTKKRSIEDFKAHINRAIDTLIKANEDLKKKERLDKAEIKKLYKTLKGVTLDIFYFIGVAPIALKAC